MSNAPERDAAGTASDAADPLRAWVASGSVPRHFTYSRRLNVLYVTNQKSGCSTLKQWLQRIELDDPEWSPPVVHKHSRMTPVPKPAELARLLSGEAYVFSFSRHPVVRSLSVYLNKILPKSKYLRAGLHHLFGFHPRDTAGKISFDEFIAALEQHAAEPQALDPHWRPQFHNLRPDLVSYRRIGKLETFDKDIAAIIADCRVPPPFDKVAARNQKTGANDLLGAYFRFPAGPYRATGAHLPARFRGVRIPARPKGSLRRSSKRSAVRSGGATPVGTSRQDAAMAEREGFEPSERLRAQRFSRPPRSTTPAPLRALRQLYPGRGRADPIDAARR